MKNTFLRGVAVLWACAVPALAGPITIDFDGTTFGASLQYHGNDSDLSAESGGEALDFPNANNLANQISEGDGGTDQIWSVVTSQSPDPPPGDTVELTFVFERLFAAQVDAGFPLAIEFQNLNEISNKPFVIEGLITGEFEGNRGNGDPFTQGWTLPSLPTLSHEGGGEYILAMDFGGSGPASTVDGVVSTDKISIITINATVRALPEPGTLAILLLPAILLRRQVRR